MSELSPNTRPKSPARKRAGSSTGPTSEAGKSRASQNATTHGCTASLTTQARIVLPDESESEWNGCLQSWRQEYEGDTGLAADLATKAAIADWMMRRNLRRYDEAEQRLFTLQADSTLWTAEQHALLERFLRYRGIAERSFHRARNALEQARRAGAIRKTSIAAAKESQPRTTAVPAAPKPPAAFIQCVTVQVLGGKTLTLFQPKNEHLRRMIISAIEPKPTVKRALYFMHGIPDEYAWLTQDQNHEGKSHYVIERTCEQTLFDLDQEQIDGSGHVLQAKS